MENHICRMAALRIRFRISQAELAKAAGVSRQLISQIEIDRGRQSKGHEAMVRRAFSSIITARRAELDALTHDLDSIPWLFSSSEKEGEDES